MNSSDDYQDEMRFRRDLSEQDIDRLLAGVAPAGAEDLTGLADLMAEARLALVESPSEETKREHLAAIVAMAESVAADRAPAGSATGPSPVPPMWRRVVQRSTQLVMKVAAGAGAGVLALTGLAYAGVDLPGTAAANAMSNVLEIDLPNQEDSDGEGSRAGVVHAVIAAFGDERGCEFGQAVAEAASGDARSEDPEWDNPCDNGDQAEAEEEETETTEGSAKGEEGKAKAKEKSDAGKARAEAKKAEAAEKAGDAGKPESAGKSGDAGKPDTSGKSGDAGKPESPGKSGDAGKPESAGKSGDAGKPDDTEVGS